MAACEAELEKGVEPFLIAVRLAAQVGLVRAVQALADEGLGAREIAGRLYVDFGYLTSAACRG